MRIVPSFFGVRNLTGWQPHDSRQVGLASQPDASACSSSVSAIHGLAGRALGATVVAATVFLAPDISAAQPGGATYIGVITDLTGSAGAIGLDKLTVEDIAPLERCVVENGGVLAIAVIRSKTEGGTIRLTVPAGIPAPPPLNLARVPLFNRVEGVRRYRASLEAWKASEATRASHVVEQRQLFERRLHLVLDGPQADRASDVNPVLALVDRFLREPGAARRLLLTNSDLVNTTRNPPYKMTAKVDASAWVYRRTDAVRREVLPPSTMQFEGLGAGIQHIAEPCRSDSE